MFTKALTTASVSRFLQTIFVKNTVRDHIIKLYEKLDATTAVDAVMKAKELSM